MDESIVKSINKLMSYDYNSVIMMGLMILFFLGLGLSRHWSYSFWYEALHFALRLYLAETHVKLCPSLPLNFSDQLRRRISNE